MKSAREARGVCCVIPNTIDKVAELYCTSFVFYRDDRVQSSEMGYGVFVSMCCGEP